MQSDSLLYREEIMRPKTEGNNNKNGKNKGSYSIGSNYCYIYGNMWGYDKSIVIYGVIECILSVLMPLGAVIAPAIVIRLLEQQVKVPVFIQTVLLTFLGYSIITALYTFILKRNEYQYIDIRISRFTYFLFSKCLHMDYQVYEEEKTREDLKKAVNSNHNNWLGVEGFMHHNVNLFTNLLGLLVYCVIISSVSPLILLLLLLLSAIQLAAFQRAKLYEQKKKEEISKINVTQGYFMDESFDLKAAKDIRVYQLNGLMEKVYASANLRLCKIKRRINGAYYGNDVVEIVLRFLRDVVCYGYLIYLLMHGLEVSLFVLYLGIVSGLGEWIMKITRNIAEISRDHLMICDYRKFLDIKDIFDHRKGKEIGADEEALDIVFDHVSYRYSGSEEEVLKDISFHIRKGERVALVGINGAGKTTIVKLLCGFYRPTSGKILINGMELSELNVENYFEQIAVVFQDAFTLSFTIGENICGVTGDAIDQEKLENALKLSGLKNKIDSLEKGINTYLNKDMEESGIQLSGGELQKLMLARALYRNAKLLLLDEPTAALDAIAESELYEKYQQLLQGKTSLFISHRLASTRFCNYILFLENGSIVEEGAHEILMERNERYANMFRVQSQYYKEETYEAAECMA